jgi:hypothetical protein
MEATNNGSVRRPSNNWGEPTRICEATDIQQPKLLAQPDPVFYAG